MEDDLNMDALIKDMLVFGASYLMIIVGALLLFNWLSNGFLMSFIKIKMRRGKKVLVIINGKLDSYPSTGWVEGKRFKYYDRETRRDNKNKIAKFIDFEDGKPNPIIRLFGVPVIMIDEVNNKFVMVESGELGGTYDPIQQEQYIIRALQRQIGRAHV